MFENYKRNKIGTTIAFIIIICCMTLIFGICIRGCQEYKENRLHSEQIQITKIDEFYTTRDLNNDYVYTYIDKESGVEYLIIRTAYGIAMCPRYNLNGSFYIEN